MCVSEDVDHYSPRFDELQKDMSKVFDNIVRQSLEIQELKSDFADVRQEMSAKEDNMRHNMEDIVSDEVKKATRRLEEKLDALLVKLSEKDN